MVINATVNNMIDLESTNFSVMMSNNFDPGKSSIFHFFYRILPHHKANLENGHRHKNT